MEPNTPEAIITKPPIEYLAAGEFNKIPIMMGINTAEGLLLYPGNYNSWNNYAILQINLAVTAALNVLFTYLYPLFKGTTKELITKKNI